MSPSTTPATHRAHGEIHIRTHVNRTSARPPHGVPWKPVELQTRPHNKSRQDSYQLTATLISALYDLRTTNYELGYWPNSHYLKLTLLPKNL